MLKDWDELLKENNYEVEGEYCENCQWTDGEQKYLVDGVTICATCLIDDKQWKEFPQLVDLHEYQEEQEQAQAVEQAEERKDEESALLSEMGGRQ